MDLFKGIAVFVGWLTTSLAGIAAIFYACGYLVVRAQLNMLGLFGLFEYPREHYLQEGGKFFVAVTGMLIGKLLPRMVMMLYVLAFVSIIVLLFLAVCYFFRWSGFIERCGRVKSYILAMPKGWPWLWSFLLLLCFAFILVFYVLDYLNSFAAVLGVSNLLYGSSDTISGSDDASLIIRWLLQGDSQRLQLYFLHLIKGELLAIFLLTAAWYTAAVFQKARLWLVSPFIIVSVLYTIFTPMAYGVLVRPTKYAVVFLQWKDEPIAEAPSGFYLLNKSDREFVIWDRDHKKVLCISTDLVWGSQVSELRPLFHHNGKDE
jgi:hypothetical protein